MRTICCSCGRRFVAVGDKQLYHIYLGHIRESHPNGQLTDLQLHTVLVYAAHDLDLSGENTAPANEDGP